MMPSTQHSPTRGCNMEEVLANIGSEMAASTDWSEVMNLEEAMAQKEGIVKGDNEWSGDNMCEKSDRAGCRVITTRGSTFIEVRVQAVRLKLRPRPAVRLTLAL